MGASVRVTSAIGGGFPDLVVGINGNNYLLEIKDGDKSPSRQKLTKDEQEFFDCWRGQVEIIRSMEDAVSFVERVRDSNHSRKSLPTPGRSDG